MIENWKNTSLENIEGEIWKPVVGEEGKYEVSNFGRIKSLKRDLIYRLKQSDPNSKLRKKTINTIICSQRFNTKIGKYPAVRLGFKRAGKLVHRLVAIAFIPNTENKKFVNHKNRIRHDNRVDNLEWCTKEENENHSWANGRERITGDKHYKTKYPDAMVLEMRKLYESGFTTTQLAKKFGMSVSYAYMLVTKKGRRYTL